LLFSLETEIEL